MRLISGKFGRRELKTDHALSYRPTTEMVREAIFSALNSSCDLTDMNVLDLYAGTGALGFEALSRGAKSVEFVEKSQRHVSLLRENARILGVEDQVKITQMDASRFLKNDLRSRSSLPQAVFDLIFTDPPYDQHPGDKLLLWLLASGRLKEGTMVVIEGRVGLELQESVTMDGHQFLLINKKSKRYGETAVFYFSVGNVA